MIGRAGPFGAGNAEPIVAFPHHTLVYADPVGQNHIRARLKGGDCRTLSRDQRVLVDRTGLYCYPDLVIVCGPPEYSADDPDTLVNPRVVVEVLSESTERYDRTTKFRNYQQLPSMTEYVLVSQDEPLCERYVRMPDGSWALVSFVGLEAALAFASVPVQVPLADIYAGTTFPEPKRA